MIANLVPADGGLRLRDAGRKPRVKIDLGERREKSREDKRAPGDGAGVQ